MIKECLPDHCGIQKYQWAGVAVEFLKRGNSLIRHRDSQTFIVFPDSLMGTVVVVFVQIDLPVMVQFLQCADLLCLCFRYEIIHHLMKFFDFSF